MLSLKFLSEFRIFSKKLTDSLFGLKWLKWMDSFHCLNVAFFCYNPHRPLKMAIIIQKILINWVVRLYTPNQPYLSIWLIILTILSFLFIKLYVPGDTEKVPIDCPEIIQKLKKQSYCIVSVWIIISLFLTSNSNLNPYIFASSLGIFNELITLHPKTYNLVNYLFKK